MLEYANTRLIELQQANAIASSETLAKYILQARGGAGEKTIASDAEPPSVSQGAKDIRRNK
jgi:hypothetical protein